MSDTTKKKHEKTKEEEGEGDAYGNSKLEELPDEIIVHILSLLPLSDAVRTSVLSSQWRYLWTFTRLMSFNFDFDFTENHGSYRFLFEYKDDLDEKRKGFIVWVNTVMDQHLGDIKSLRVCFYFRYKHRLDIDKWIKFAMRNKSLQRLELDFSMPYAAMRNKSLQRLELDFSMPYAGVRHQYRFSHQLFSVKSVGFKSLKVISLKSVGVSGKDVKYFLSNAPLLERLAVHDSKNLVHLRVSGKSLALKHLEIMYCSKLKSVVICELNIVSLYFNHIGASKFILGNVPLLVELYISFADCSSRFKTLFSCCLSHIQVLTMEDRFRTNTAFYRKCPVIPNVKHLHLILYSDVFRVDGGLGNLRFIIDTFPNLEKLVLQMICCPSYRPPHTIKDLTLRYTKAPKCPHNRLKEVEVLEYRSKFGDMDRVPVLDQEHCCATENCYQLQVRSWPKNNGNQATIA